MTTKVRFDLPNTCIIYIFSDVFLRNKQVPFYYVINSVTSGRAIYILTPVTVLNGMGETFNNRSFTI